MGNRKQKEELDDHFIFHPLDFIEEMLIRPYNEATGYTIRLTTQQRDGIEAYRRVIFSKWKKSHKVPMTAREEEDARKIGVSIMSGKGGGKDALVAMLILHFMYSFSFPKVPCTSVSATQLHTVLWSELSKWLMYSNIKDKFVLQNDKLFCRDVPKDVIGKQWFAFTRTANPKASDKEQTETLAGIHADNMMIVADECSGMADAVFDPLEGTLTGPINFLFLIFNPTRTKGYAIRSQYEDSKYWITLQWDSRDSEIANRDNIERIKERYGEDSNPWRIRVLGLPPLTDENTTYPADWITQAVRYNEEDDDAYVIPENAVHIKGLDCGGGGDMSVIGKRRGHYIYPFKRNNTADSMVLIDWAFVDIQIDPPDAFRVDTIGLGWAVEGGIRSKLADVKKTQDIVEACSNARQADNPERFYNKRAESHWRIRDVLERGVLSIPNDQNLIDAMMATKHEEARGVLKIIDKKKIKKELEGKSPNELDTIALTYFKSDDTVTIFSGEKQVYCNNVSRKHEKQAWMRA